MSELLPQAEANDMEFALLGSPQSRPLALWGGEKQGSERSFPRQRETELSGLCDEPFHVKHLPYLKSLSPIITQGVGKWFQGFPAHLNIFVLFMGAIF